jgi:hypothetical protein
MRQCHQYHAFCCPPHHTSRVMPHYSISTLTHLQQNRPQLILELSQNVVLSVEKIPEVLQAARSRSDYKQFKKLNTFNINAYNKLMLSWMYQQLCRYQ